MQAVVANKLDIDDVLYHFPGGPILVRDVIYGYHVEIEASGQEFFAHKTGFTKASMQNFMLRAGFNRIISAYEKAFEIVAARILQPNNR